MFSLFGKKEAPEASLLDRLKESVSKTRTALSARVGDIFRGERHIDPTLFAELEAALVSADVGVRTTREILDAVRAKLDRQGVSDASRLKAEIKAQLVGILTASENAVA